jgi:hypothetical protein
MYHTAARHGFYRRTGVQIHAFLTLAPDGETQCRCFNYFGGRVDSRSGLDLVADRKPLSVIRIESRSKAILSHFYFRFKILRINVENLTLDTQMNIRKFQLSKNTYLS